jgi:hypothetical protein
VYLSLTVVIAGVLGQGGSGVGVGELQTLLGDSRRTLRRWRRWWTTLFVESRFWQSARPGDEALALVHHVDRWIELLKELDATRRRRSSIIPETGRV